MRLSPLAIRLPYCKVHTRIHVTNIKINRHSIRQTGKFSVTVTLPACVIGFLFQSFLRVWPIAEILRSIRKPKMLLGIRRDRGVPCVGVTVFA